MVLYTLRIGSLNIQGGLSDKCSIKEFSEMVKCFDLFCIQETWLTETQNLHIDNYKLFRSDRVKNKKACRGSGGVVVLFKKGLEKGLQKINSKTSDIRGVSRIFERGGSNIYWFPKKKGIRF